MTTDFVRGNLKKVLLLLMLTFCAAGVYAQSSMSDSQVMEYIAKEYQKGTSQAQIVTKLMQNGVQISQIRRVRDQYQRMKKHTLAELHRPHVHQEDQPVLGRRGL